MIWLEEHLKTTDFQFHLKDVVSRCAFRPITRGYDVWRVIKSGIFMLYSQVILTIKHCTKHPTELFWKRLEHLTAERWIAGITTNAQPTIHGWLICFYPRPHIITPLIQIPRLRTSFLCRCSWNTCWFILTAAQITGLHITCTSTSITAKLLELMALSTRPIAGKDNQANWLWDCKSIRYLMSMRSVLGVHMCVWVRWVG